MSNIRLSSANTDSARRTMELTKFKPSVSMSGAEKSSNMKQSNASKALEQRREYFRGKQA